MTATVPIAAIFFAACAAAQAGGAGAVLVAATLALYAVYRRFAKAELSLG